MTVLLERSLTKINNRIIAPIAVYMVKTLNDFTVNDKPSKMMLIVLDVVNYDPAVAVTSWRTCPLALLCTTTRTSIREVTRFRIIHKQFCYPLKESNHSYFISGELGNHSTVDFDEGGWPGT